jgi:hypothetical protein
MQQERTRTFQRRRTAKPVPKPASAVDYHELWWSFQHHWPVITPIWAFLPAVFAISRVLGGLLDYSIVYWAFSIMFFGTFLFLSYRTYELVAENRLPVVHWLILVWVPWLPLAVLSNAVISSL